MKKWNPNNWTKFPAKHLPVYTDKNELDMVLGKLKNIHLWFLQGKQDH